MRLRRSLSWGRTERWAIGRLLQEGRGTTSWTTQRVGGRFRIDGAMTKSRDIVNKAEVMVETVIKARLIMDKSTVLMA